MSSFGIDAHTFGYIPTFSRQVGADDAHLFPPSVCFETKTLPAVVKRFLFNGIEEHRGGCVKRYWAAAYTSGANVLRLSILFVVPVSLPPYTRFWFSGSATTYSHILFSRHGPPFAVADLSVVASDAMHTLLPLSAGRWLHCRENHCRHSRELGCWLVIPG